MPFCSKCGNEVAEDVNFCNKCGNAMQKLPTPAPIPVKIPTSPNLKKGKKSGILMSIVRITLAVFSCIVIAIVAGWIYENVQRDKRNTKVQEENAKIQRIADELKNNPNKYVFGSDCIATTEFAQSGKIIQKVTKGLVNVTSDIIKNCTFENKSDFYIKGISGSIYAKNKSGATVDVPFVTDCILKPKENKPCDIQVGNFIMDGFASGKVKINSVGYSSDGRF